MVRFTGANPEARISSSHSPGFSAATSKSPSLFTMALRISPVATDFNCKGAPATGRFCGSSTLPLNVAKLLCATSATHPHTDNKARAPELFMGSYLSGSRHLKGITEKYYAVLRFERGFAPPQGCPPTAWLRSGFGVGPS